VSLDLGIWSLINGAGLNDSSLGGRGVVRLIVDISICMYWYSAQCGLYGVTLWIVSHKHIQERKCTILLYLHSEFDTGSEAVEMM